MAIAEPERDDYTVGWICVLPFEFSACRLMLDEEYGDVDAALRSDKNTYVGGRIRKHYVVVTCLPEGSFGTTPAATVAANLLASFPNLRFGVLVGVSGGVPSKDHDIRLGDVVVSRPEATKGGVVQYDLGKETLSGFEPVGSLNRPPTVLLTAVAKLRSNHQLRRNKMLGFLSEIPDDFRRPNTSDDLYEATYEHVPGGTNGACDHCDKSRRVSRTARPTDDPTVHYGTIASGNRVIANGTVRDQLHSQHKALCFDTEAAGLMNDLSCIVVRGIGNYCDSHSNQEWALFAAASAAAWARELVEVVHSVTVASMPRASQQDDAEAIRSAVNPIAHGLQTSAILRWLSMPENYHTALTRGLLEQQQEQQQAVPALEEKKES